MASKPITLAPRCCQSCITKVVIRCFDGTLSWDTGAPEKATKQANIVRSYLVAHPTPCDMNSVIKAVNTVFFQDTAAFGY